MADPKKVPGDQNRIRKNAMKNKRDPFYGPDDLANVSNAYKDAHAGGIKRKQSLAKYLKMKGK
jgi:hypothetical protein